MGNERPLLSIVIPAYNAGRCLAQCLDSIEREADESIQVVVIDDGSTDDTSQVATAYHQQHPHLYLNLFKQNNQGVAAARNAGLLRSKARYVAFVDADDQLRAGWRKALQPYAEGHFDMVSFRMEDTRPHTNRIDRSIPQGRLSCQKVMELYCSSYELNSACARLISIDFLRNHGIQFQRGIAFGEDALFMGEVIRNHPSVFQSDAVFYRYVDNVQSATHTIADRMDDASVLISTKHRMAKTLDRSAYEASCAFLTYCFFYDLKLSIRNRRRFRHQFSGYVKYYWQKAQMDAVCLGAGEQLSSRNAFQKFCVTHHCFGLLQSEILLEILFRKLIP